MNDENTIPVHRNVSGWTLDTLYTHLSQVISDVGRRSDDHTYAAEKALQLTLAGFERAISKAEIATEKRFDSVNDFRGTLSNQLGHFVTRDEVNIKAATITEKIEALSSRMDRSEARGLGLNAGWGYLVGAAGAVFGLIAVAITLFGIARHGL